MRWVVLIGTAAVIASAGAIAQEEKVELSAVPKNVLDTATKEVSGFAATSANTEMEGGKKIYEIQGTAGGKKVEVDVFEDGTLDEVETQISASEVPAPVLAAIKGKMPSFRVSKAEHSRRPNGEIYEIEGDADGKQWDVELRADGSNMQVNELKKGS